MINFADLVKVTATRASSTVDLTIDTKTNKISLGARIQALLGTMAFGLGTDKSTGDVILYLDPAGKIYPQRYHKSGDNVGEAMNRGGSFTSPVLVSLIVDTYPGVTQFDMLKEEMKGWEYPAFRLSPLGQSKSDIEIDASAEVGPVRDQVDEPAVPIGDEVSDEVEQTPETTRPYDL